MGYPIVDYTDKYGAVMQFSKNKDAYIHQWYPFVEGYSGEFIKTILNEYGELPTLCLDPFSGSGTTSLELQKRGVKCYSLEVNPFMHLLTRVKLRTDYRHSTFQKHFETILDRIDRNYELINIDQYSNKYKTIVEKEGLKKWNYHESIFSHLLYLKSLINEINDKKYRELFMICWSNILLETSNLYRDGKCLRYKKEWEKRELSKEEVNALFTESLEKIRKDIIELDSHKKRDKLISNSDYVILGDCRETIKEIPDNCVDLVITSPPYLNSRDYTDCYMIEMRLLDFLDEFDTIQDYRKKTLRSHVQVKWSDVKASDSVTLKNTIKKLEKHKADFWNSGLLNMINGYFDDMNLLLQQLFLKLKNNGRIYLNVADSAYYGVEIKVAQIIADLAENNGFKVYELRLARKIKSSSQQKEQIPYLNEYVIVLKKSMN